LRPVDIAADPDLPVLGADRAGAVVGRQLSTSLPAGALLSEGLLGPSMLPADGQAIVALTLKPGQLPVEVAAGAQVLVVLVPAQAGVAPGTGTGPGGPGSGGVGWAAVVTAVAPSSDSAVTVVSVQLPMESARRVAAVPAGQLSVVLVGRR
jgi:hypothetical protein